MLRAKFTSYVPKCKVRMYFLGNLWPVTLPNTVATTSTPFFPTIATVNHSSHRPTHKSTFFLYSPMAALIPILRGIHLDHPLTTFPDDQHVTSHSITAAFNSLSPPPVKSFDFCLANPISRLPAHSSRIRYVECCRDPRHWVIGGDPDYS